ncbi:uncharacterized protein LOC114967970 isoform X3 [Acropora millepora]|uniref:uncharacterized protein LOC114967970 isoform X3 n=1 Tax=Acropora millepora TaxID=45264 RepID=UPI0010FC7E5F|nr:uncharacterized protein LOC114967970 isoform X3 [Acropora millepora]
MMATNRGQRYFVLIVAIFHELVYGLNYPSIQWNYQNTRFQQGMYHLNVLPDAKVMVICPHTAISFVKTDLQTPADILFENFWQVDYASFQSCNVNTSNPRNKRFFKCEDPQKLQYEQFIFQSFGIGNRPTFEKGKTHYFISTANGSKESLDWTSGGHCDEYNMRLKIYVCQNSEDVLCSGAQTTTPTTAPITASSVPVNGNEVLLALTPNAPQTRRTQNVFERNEAQTTAAASVPKFPVNETDGLSALALEASEKPRTRNVCEGNVLLMATIITLGLLLLISLVVNIIFIKKMKSRKSPTSQTNDSDTACDV